MTYPRETGKKKIIPLTKPFFDNREEKAAVAVLRSGWHTQGLQTELFEKEFARIVDAKYAVALSSCTAALHLALILARVGVRDEVIVPSFTYIACANVIRYVQGTPVFVEVDEKTFNIDAHDLEKKITKRTKAIIAVDQVGLPCDIDIIHKIAKRYNLFVIEDAACAIGSKYKGRMVGNLSAIACFSLHPRKIISTGEGGVITTNDKNLARAAKELRSHGASIGAHARHTAKVVSFEKYNQLGYNYRITDIQATIGRQQLKKLPMILKRRKFLAERYTKKLARLSTIETPFVPSYAQPNWQTYVIRLNRNYPLSQKRLMQKLLDCGISTRRGAMVSHLEPYYKNFLGTISLPKTEALAKSTIALPLYPQMTIHQQDYVINNLYKFVDINKY